MTKVIVNSTGLTGKQDRMTLKLVSTQEGIKLSILFSQCKPKRVSVKSFLKHLSKKAGEGLLFIKEKKVLNLETVVRDGGYKAIIVKTK